MIIVSGALGIDHANVRREVPKSYQLAQRYLEIVRQSWRWSGVH
jgi:hypothetical protein